MNQILSDDVSTQVANSQVEVKITGIDVPFGQLFELILKASLAAIPAYIVLFLLGITVGAAITIMVR